MKILSIDTSSDICSVAIIEDKKIIRQMHNKSEKEHSQTLMPMIKEILETCNLELTDMNAFACGIGPRFFYRNKNRNCNC